jgi:hypothetical protein
MAGLAPGHESLPPIRRAHAAHPVARCRCASHPASHSPARNHSADVRARHRHDGPGLRVSHSPFPGRRRVAHAGRTRRVLPASGARDVVDLSHGDRPDAAAAPPSRAGRCRARDGRAGPDVPPRARRACGDRHRCGEPRPLGQLHASRWVGRSRIPLVETSCAARATLVDALLLDLSISELRDRAAGCSRDSLALGREAAESHAMRSRRRTRMAHSGGRAASPLGHRRIAPQRIAPASSWPTVDPRLGGSRGYVGPGLGASRLRDRGRTSASRQRTSRHPDGCGTVGLWIRFALFPVTAPLRNRL